MRFWANHFTVSVRPGRVAPFVGDLVRTAIRLNARTHFADMLLAVMRHPAMLLYLNQANSIGPGSPAWLRLRRGLTRTSPASALSCTRSPPPSALLGLATAASLGRVHLVLVAAPTDRRFVVVLLRGALDGLAAVQPYGDPALRDLPLMSENPWTLCQAGKSAWT